MDIVVAQGYEAGGHTGEIATMVLVPEIVDAVGDVPVLAAGGIGSGRQVAAALALGAPGVWMGSDWLTTAEYTQSPATPGGSGAARGPLADTVRTRIYTGKPARLLKTRWTEAWAAPDAPDPLPMPLQNLLVSEAHQRITRSGDPEVVSMPVGQIVGRMNEVRPVAEVMAALVRSSTKPSKGWRATGSRCRAALGCQRMAPDHGTAQSGHGLKVPVQPLRSSKVATWRMVWQPSRSTRP